MTTIKNLGFASRRLSAVSDFAVEAQSLAQPVDIDISLGGRETKPISGFERYFRVGLDAAREGITRAAHAGIPTAVVRFVGSVDDPDDSLPAQAESLKWLIDHVEGDIALVVDPFGLDLNADLSWGIQTAPKEIDVERTLVLIKKIARAFGAAGAAGIFTLGRVENEVMVTRAELDAIGSTAKIYCVFAE
jgi:delta-aminolevulinic acid dehydratase/porphobilinogen synthase